MIARRRRPLSLTDRQLQALATYLDAYLDDFLGGDGRRREGVRIREIVAKVDAELDHRDLAGPILVGRDPLTGIRATIVGPIRRG